MRGHRRVIGAALVLAAGCAGSPPEAREYELTGQVLAVDPARQEITIRHDDIPRFMPGMTMAFKVRDARLLDGREPGDLVRARLVLEEADAHLSEISTAGSAPLPEAPAPGARALEPGDPVADVALTDAGGLSRRLSDWRGLVLAVTFVYTRCPVATFCPQMDRRFRDVQAQVRADPALAGHVRLLSISFDPAHDTPAVLAGHAAVLGADPAIWQFATGDREDVEAFAAQFGVSILERDAGTGEITHNLRTAVVGADRRLAAILSGSDWTPARLVDELKAARGTP